MPASQIATAFGAVAWQAARSCWLRQSARARSGASHTVRRAAWHGWCSAWGQAARTFRLTWVGHRCQLPPGNSRCRAFTKPAC